MRQELRLKLAQCASLAELDALFAFLQRRAFHGGSGFTQSACGTTRHRRYFA